MGRSKRVKGRSASAGYREMILGGVPSGNNPVYNPAQSGGRIPTNAAEEQP